MNSRVAVHARVPLRRASPPAAAAAAAFCQPVHPEQRGSEERGLRKDRARIGPPRHKTSCNGRARGSNENGASGHGRTCTVTIVQGEECL